jgi:hypothetical protein
MFMLKRSVAKNDLRLETKKIEKTLRFDTEKLDQHKQELAALEIQIHSLQEKIKAAQKSLVKIGR